MRQGYPTELGGNLAAANAIKQAALIVADTHSTILVSWEHYNIQFLTADLGVSKSKIPTWKGSDCLAARLEPSPLSPHDTRVPSKVCTDWQTTPSTCSRSTQPVP